MRKKILAIFIVGILFLTGVSYISLGKPISIKNNVNTTDISNDIVDNSNHTYGNFFIVTVGPILKLISKVKIQDGPFLIKLLINRNLNRRILRLSAILPMMIYPISNGINFTIEYKRNVKNNSRYSYSTTYCKVLYDENGSYIGVDLENATAIYSEAHKIKIENFRFAFAFKRLRLLLLRAPLGQKIINPARFLFLGFCDNLTIE